MYLQPLKHKTCHFGVFQSTQISSKWPALDIANIDKIDGSLVFFHYSLIGQFLSHE